MQRSGVHRGWESRGLNVNITCSIRSVHRGWESVGVPGFVNEASCRGKEAVLVVWGFGPYGPQPPARGEILKEFVSSSMDGGGGDGWRWWGWTQRWQCRNAPLLSLAGWTSLAAAGSISSAGPFWWWSWWSVPTWGPGWWWCPGNERTPVSPGEAHIKLVTLLTVE